MKALKAKASEAEKKAAESEKTRAALAKSLINRPDVLLLDLMWGIKGAFLRNLFGDPAILRVPSFAEVPYPVQMQPHLVVEFYS